MSEARTVARTEIDVNGRRHLLAQGQDPEELKRRMASAAAAGGAFVDFAVAGGGTVSVLISGAVRVTFSSEDVEPEERDADVPRARRLVLV